ncbi:ABC transporter permease [Thermococcus sp.]
MGNGLKAIISIAYLNLTSLFRSPLWIFAQLLTPMGIILILYFLGGERALLYGLIGATVATTVHASLSVSRLVVILKLIGFQDIFIASPVTSLEYMLGLSLSRLIGALPATFIFVALMFYKLSLTPSSLGLIIFLILLTWIQFSLIAFSVSLYIKNLVHVDAITMILSTALILLPPVYYPLTKLPPILQKIALLVPTTYTAEILRNALLNGSGYSIYLIGILIYCSISMILISKRLRWGV